MSLSTIRGVGTNGTFDMSAAFADARVEENAQQAYAQFADAAAAWLDKNPGGSVTTAITAFSRGGPTGIRFAQLLNEKGLTLSDGTVMQISVSAMALIDPVGTTVADGKSVIPPNVEFATISSSSVPITNTVLPSCEKTTTQAKITSTSSAIIAMSAAALVVAALANWCSVERTVPVG